METQIHPDFLVDCPRPSLSFDIPTQGNHQETISPFLSISDLHIELYCKTMQHVFNVIDPNSPLRESHYIVETTVPHPIYLRTDSLESDLITVLSDWEIPEIHHEYIVYFTRILVDAITEDFDTLFTQPLLLSLGVSCHKYYSPNVNGFFRWCIMRCQESLIEATYRSDEEPSEDSTYDESDDEDYNESQEYSTDDDEYYYDWFPEFDEIDRMMPASESSIKSLVVTTKMKRGGIGEKEEGSSCSICLEEFLDGSLTGCMPCSHMFHEECIIDWLRRSHYCPLCRFEIPTTVSD